jgi:hypothetical protein
MRLVQPVTDVSGFVGGFNRIKRQHADQVLILENQKHFGVAALVQHLITQHITTGVIFGAHMLRPVKGGLQPGFVSDDHVVQIGGIALFDGAKLEMVSHRDYFRFSGGHGPFPSPSPRRGEGINGQRMMRSST